MKHRKKTKGFGRFGGGYGKEAGEKDGNASASPGSMTAGAEKADKKKHGRKYRK